MNTDLPAVSASQLAGVRSTAEAPAISMEIAANPFIVKCYGVMEMVGLLLSFELMWTQIEASRDADELLN